MTRTRLGTFAPALGIALTCGCALEVNGQTFRYVDQNVVGGAQDGTDWENAYPDLWDALLTIAPTSGSVDYQIWVAEGTYQPKFWVFGINRAEATFPLLPRVQIYGGFPGPYATSAERDDLNDRDEAAYPTILLGLAVGQPPSEVEGCSEEAGDCFDANMTPGCDQIACCEAVCAFNPECCDTAWDGDCVKAAEVLPGCEPPPSNSRSVVTGWLPDTDEDWIRRLDGLIITGGGNRPAPTALCGGDTWGGGVHLDGIEFNNLLSMDIVRCEVVNNYAHQGGGIAVRSMNPVGIGVPNPFLSRTFTRIYNSDIVENEAPTYGAGINIFGYSAYEIVNSVIARNVLISLGLIDPEDPEGGPVPPCLFQLGAGLFESYIQQNGPGIMPLERCIINSTIVRNCGAGIAQGSESPEMSLLLVANSIVRNNGVCNEEGEFVFDCEAVAFSCNQIVGLPTVVFTNSPDAVTGSGNIDADALFVNLTAGDYRLQVLSPCVDAGDHRTYVPMDKLDVDNDDDDEEPTPDRHLRPRVVPAPGVNDCPEVDMGAFELVNDDCDAGDLDASGLVDGGDLGILLGFWGPCSSCAADIDCDGEVGGSDLGILLGGWDQTRPYPRTCSESMNGSSGSNAGGHSENQSSGGVLTLAQLQTLLGFSSMPALVHWLAQQPYVEMVAWLELLIP